MKCLRCGYCCKNYCVAIVDDPNKGIHEDNIVIHEGNGPCKHLCGNKPGDHSCAIHDEPWYRETPCARHSQIENRDSPCRMGVYVLQNERQ